MIDNLTDHQPALTINTGDAVHVISIVTIRQLAAGAEYRGDKDQLVRVLCTALRDMMNETGVEYD